MKERFTSILSKYIPEAALPYSVSLWEKYPFSFKVKKDRRSKLGDYRYHRIKKQHIITVNGSINPYHFLITYIHEFAHLVQYEKHGNNQPPHGRIWKNLFAELMAPVLQPGIFPPDLLMELKRHMKNPRASSYSDQKLAKLIKKYDQPRSDEEILLEEIPAGDFFELHGKTFEKIEKRRTRSLCLDIRTGKRYLISELAVVKKN